MITVQQKAQEILAAHSGYIQAKDLDILQKAMTVPMSRGIVSFAELETMQSRIDAMIASGIQALFEPALYTGVNVFPIMEFFIHFGIGRYFDHVHEYVGGMLRSGRLHRGENFRKFRIPSVSVEDVVQFRNRVFINEHTIDPAFMREAHLYIEEHFKSKEGVEISTQESRDRIAMDILQSRLSALPFQRTEKVAFDGNVNELVSKWGWYHSYNQKRRRTILHQWRQDLPPHLGNNRTILQRLERIFPEEFEGFALQQATKVRALVETIAEEGVANAEKSEGRTFRGIPKPVYEDRNLWKKFGPRIVTAFRNACRELADNDPEWVFGNAHDMGRKIGLPLGRMCLVEFKEELDAIRLATAARLPEELFLKLFGGGHGSPGKARRVTIGHSKHGVESEVARALRQYVCHRWREMSGS